MLAVARVRLSGDGSVQALLGTVRGRGRRGGSVRRGAAQSGHPGASGPPAPGEVSV